MHPISVGSQKGIYQYDTTPSLPSSAHDGRDLAPFLSGGSEAHTVRAPTQGAWNVHIKSDTGSSTSRTVIQYPSLDCSTAHAQVSIGSSTAQSVLDPGDGGDRPPLSIGLRIPEWTFKLPCCSPAGLSRRTLLLWGVSNLRARASPSAFLQRTCVGTWISTSEKAAPNPNRVAL